MRLTNIKLAGFKSFVDPTHINIPGQLVGVVGPNGCGKSNIIDAVRWVLGESRASALRGDSMQDVIFNGSSMRKPIARASVELVFDNSLGKAAGQWSQYAEISLKRVLTREGESSYLINNSNVRRRDVHDIFLGTGLGPRAYAIIEQGMISRIIEAKPEELRVFLEEAAGVSKYKERRRETENRLADTRDNLARVEDIRRELGAQIEKLASQAEVARRYNELSADRQFKQNLLWVLRKLDAQADSECQSREIETARIELESQTARLRETEKQLEQARSEHYAAGDAQNAAQGELYRSNSEVARLETEIRHIVDTRQRLENQLVQLRAQRDIGERQAGELRGAAQMWQQRRSACNDRVEVSQARLADAENRLPEAESLWREVQAAHVDRRRLLAQSEQAFQLEQAHLSHASRVLDGLSAREERLRLELTSLSAPDPAELADLQASMEESRSELQRQQALLTQVENAEAVLGAARERAALIVQAFERELSSLEGRALALQRIQNQIEENGQIHDWTDRHELSALPRLWQKVRVEPGWENAIESVLRERLHALELDAPEKVQRLLEDPPPSKVSAFSGGVDQIEDPVGNGTVQDPAMLPLVYLVQGLDPAVKPLLFAWLKGYFAIDGIPQLESRTSLAPDVVLVNREGHQFSRYGVGFHASDPVDTGIFARQREIDQLSEEVKRIHGEVNTARQALSIIESRCIEHAEGLDKLRAAGSALKQRNHERELERLRLNQSREKYQDRVGQLDRELLDIAEQKAVEEEARVRSDSEMERHRACVEEFAEALDGSQQQLTATEQALSTARQELAQAEREAQEAAFREKECEGKIGEIDRSLTILVGQLEAGSLEIDQFSGEYADLSDQDLRRQLQQALEERVAHESSLAAARIRQDEASSRLHALEVARTECEERLQPLRDRIADLRLKEQAARINFEQYQLQLSEACADESALVAMLKEGQKASSLQAEITRLTNAISELGAINMAALEELVTSRERKQFLDAQSADLTEALDTIETAIRKIDRETQDLLQNTFTVVNEHFGRMFPALFGGGEARLLMLGEHILDSGVQVIARPPGKKNSSIHLLSGGEKALTAIALVFSFFQLNPAPFCLLDEVDAPLDDANTERFCKLVSKMSQHTQFLFISHNKISMEMANQLVGVTMQEQGVSRVVAVDIDEAMKLREEIAA
ncbi:MAG: chromosome segregation protein SMC [Betaproteobacteria bacterium]|nr:chromosome segregation protein SMC [Betaproteobacteria bacterium]